MKRSDYRNNLHLYLATSGKTIKDLKVEVTLEFCLNLISEYIKAEEGNIEIDYEEEYHLSDEEQKIIYTQVKQLETKILEQGQIYSLDVLQKVISDTSSKQSIIKAQLVEPMSYFYNQLTKKFISKINYIFKNDKIYYVPEQLALYMIIDMNEKGYSFKKFDFIEIDEILELIGIYNRINLKLKREKNINLTTPIEKQTIISKMQHLSAYLINELTKAKYKK